MNDGIPTKQFLIESFSIVPVSVLIEEISLTERVINRQMLFDLDALMFFDYPVTEEAYNEIIEKCAAHYGAYIVRLTESRMSRLDYAKYTCDGKLHPNAEGMAIWAELIEDSFKKCYIK